MANTLAEVIPQILAQGLMALRENVVMPALVNSDYSEEAKEKGNSVDVPIPSAIAAQDVSPAATPPVTADIAPTTVSVPLDQWKEAPFYLSDKDLKEAVNGVIPMQASEAVKSIANAVNAHIMAQYKGIYGFYGTPGTTPFGSGTTDATQVRKILNQQLAPLQDRRLVFDTEAEANALDLRAFQDMSFSGDAAAIRDGKINRKLGFDWFMDQDIPVHTAGGATGYLVNDAAVVTGVKSVSVDTGAGVPVTGDIFTVAGDSQTYTITGVTGAGPITAMTFEPAIQVAWADNAAITFKDSHTVNLAFHRDAFAFASRPLLDLQSQGLGSIIQSATDPVSGLTMRLELTREHKRYRWSFDMLYGAALARRELAARLAG